MADHENPCQTCPDTCCSLKGDCGLRLARDEYERLFKNSEQDLFVRVEGKVVIISTKEGLVCPNLGEKGCRVYADRPLDCHLYPYQMLPVFETKKKVKILLYMTRECMEKRSFCMSEKDAADIVRRFCRKVYGDKEISIRVYQNRFFPKLLNKGETVMMNIFAKLGWV